MNVNFTVFIDKILSGEKRQTIRRASPKWENVKVGDFRNIPFADGSFAMVLFDPPHLKNVGKNAWTAKKYGILGDDWRDDLRRGFAECFRVLRAGGTLVF